MLQANIETNPLEEFTQARINMVQNQLIPNQITNPALLEAMSSVPRHVFVDEKWSQVAYVDCALPITANRKLLEPLLFAKMVEACKIDKTSKVLDIGCGFGYSSIILSKIADSVIGVENDIAAITQAKYLTGYLGITNCLFKAKELFDYFVEGLLFDVIFINGALQTISPFLFDQLDNKGRLIVLEPLKRIMQLTLYTKSPKGITKEELLTSTADFLY